MLGKILPALALAYLALLIPEPQPLVPTGAGKTAFAWKRDESWASLEKQFQQLRALGCESLDTPIDAALAEIQRSLDSLAATNLPPDDPIFDRLEANFFELSPMISACPRRLPELMKIFSEMRWAIKQQSEHWRRNSAATSGRLYRSLYGGRAALEEAMLQSPRNQFASTITDPDEPSATPSAVVAGVTLHSGDILVSRGGAATSALIARGNDFTGNFSHIALVHIDEATRQVSVIEAHIESGVVVAPMEQYLADRKLRIMVLRLRAELPPLVADPQLPHRAATATLRAATNAHIPYDFTMDWRDPAKQFCSEVASMAYARLGVDLWMHRSQVSSPGVVAWLTALGVRHFETQLPSDLEYDPQLRVVAEWRDLDALFKDHADNAVTDVMLEHAEAGQPLDYNRWLLPATRLAKAWSAVQNWRGAVGPVPEGMSATTALRVKNLIARHAALQARLLVSAEQFKAEHGYTPPYWELVQLARKDAAR